MDKIKLKTGNLAYKQHLEKSALKQKLDLEYEELKLILFYYKFKSIALLLY